jgi:hypothetical protein
MLSTVIDRQASVGFGQMKALNRLRYQLRVSTAAGLQSAGWGLLTMAALLPVAAIINWVFDRRRTDWKLSLALGGSLSLIWCMAVFVSTLVDLRRAASRRREMKQVFPATAFIGGLYSVTVLLAGAISIGTYREGDSVWLQLAPLSFLAIAFYGWPRAIHCDENKIWQRSRLGTKRSIHYDNVIAVAYSQGTTTVTGTPVVIEHTQYHADVGQFQRLLSKRTGKDIH